MSYGKTQTNFTRTVMTFCYIKIPGSINWLAMSNKGDKERGMYVKSALKSKKRPALLLKYENNHLRYNTIPVK